MSILERLEKMKSERIQRRQETARSLQPPQPLDTRGPLPDWYTRKGTRTGYAPDLVQAAIEGRLKAELKLIADRQPAPESLTAPADGDAVNQTLREYSLIVEDWSNNPALPEGLRQYLREVACDMTEMIELRSQ